MLVSHAVARILIVARAKANRDSTFRKAVTSREIHEGYNCFSKKTAPIFKRKKHGAVYFIIALVALFLVCHAIIIDNLVLCFTFSCKLCKKGPEILKAESALGCLNDKKVHFIITRYWFYYKLHQIVH